MTSEHSRQAWTEDELAGFTEKLQTWGGTLSEKEQGLLMEILGRAAGAGDVGGYAQSDYYLKFRAEPTRGSESAAHFKFFHPGQSGLLLPAVRQIALD